MNHAPLHTSSKNPSARSHRHRPTHERADLWRRGTRDDLVGARAAFLALDLADAGRERRALATSLTALADHLPRYQRAVRHYAQHPHPNVDHDARWDGLPIAGAADVHLRKELT